MNPSPFTVLVADDHALVVRGLSSLIGAHASFRVIAECADGEAALEGLRRLAPAIAILDLRMPARDGLSVLAAAADEQLATRIVLVAATMDDAQVTAAVERGAWGLVLKEWASDVLMECLAEIAAGRRWLPESLVAPAIKREAARRLAANAILAPLSPRERQVCRLAANGLSPKQIGGRLDITVGTAKLHLHSIYRKLGVTSRRGMLAAVEMVRDRLGD